MKSWCVTLGVRLFMFVHQQRSGGSAPLSSTCRHWWVVAIPRLGSREQTRLCFEGEFSCVLSPETVSPAFSSLPPCFHQGLIDQGFQRRASPLLHVTWCPSRDRLRSSFRSSKRVELWLLTSCFQWRTTNPLDSICRTLLYTALPWPLIVGCTSELFLGGL